MKNAKTGILASMLFITSMLAAQNVSSVYLLEERLEQLSEEEEYMNWENELEELSMRLQEPVNLNTVTKQQLEQFPFLTDIQIENLLAYLYIHGQMQTLYELQLIEGMDKRTIDLLLPFVCVQAVSQQRGYPSLKQVWKYGKQEVLTRLDVPFYTRKGYEKNYSGPPLYHSLRCHFHYGDYLHIGFTGEKDAGEPFFALHNRKGYDHYSYYFLLRNAGRIKALALGNYRLDFGQGLVLNSGFRLGKTYSLSASEYRTEGIRRHGSTDEYNYFRGVAATVAILPSLDFSAFYSHRSLDGVVKNGLITSIDKTGLHRTENEVNKLDALALQLTGGNLSYSKNRLKVGATGIFYFFDRPYQPKLEKYAKYNLHGSRFYNVSMDYKYRLGRFAWTGEAASGTKGYALLNQLRYRFSTDYQLLLVHRYYSHDYWAMFARSFGESSTPQNENGWYLAAEAVPWAHWRFFASLDLFSFPWWKYRISKPSQGMDVMFRTTYDCRKNLSMYVDYRYKRKERDVTGTSGKVILPVFHHRFRYRLTYTPGFCRFRTTLDYNHFHSQGKPASQGYQCTQSGAYTFPTLPLSFSLQATYFHTDDYDSRVYASEKGLLYTFYVPSYSGRGFRYSAHLRYDLGKTWMFLLKFGQTVYQDRESIGSGNDLIPDHKKTDLQMQVRIKW